MQFGQRRMFLFLVFSILLFSVSHAAKGQIERSIDTHWKIAASEGPTSELEYTFLGDTVCWDPAGSKATGNVNFSRGKGVHRTYDISKADCKTLTRGKVYTFGETVFEYSDTIISVELLENTLPCLTNCHSIYDVCVDEYTTSKEITASFVGGNVSSYQILGFEEDVPYTGICNSASTNVNGTLVYDYYSCMKTRDVFVQDFEGFTGCKKIKVMGQKGPYDNVDNIPWIHGVEFPEFAWWNATWTSQIPFTVTYTDDIGGATTLVDYPQHAYIALGSYAGGDGNGSEIRITWLNGTEQEIEFYRGAEWDYSNASGMIHFKCPLLTNNTEEQFYLYYQNSSTVTDSSDGNATFPFFFDDFEDGSVDTSVRWDGGITNCGEANGLLTCVGGTAALTQGDWGYGFLVHIYAHLDHTAFASDKDIYAGFVDYGGTGYETNFRKRTEAFQVQVYDNQYSNINIGTQGLNEDAVYEMVRVNGTNASFWMNYTTFWNITTDVPAGSTLLEIYLKGEVDAAIFEEVWIAQFNENVSIAVATSASQDNSGVTVNTPSTDSWTLDATPEINYTLSGSTDARLCWQSVNSGAYTEITGGNTSGSHLYNTSTLPDGMSVNVTVKCEVTDVNYSSYINLNVDTTPPTVTVNSPASASEWWIADWGSTNMSINYTVVDTPNASDEVDVNITLDALSPGSWSWVDTNLSTRTNLTNSSTIPSDNFQLNFTITTASALGCSQADYGDIRVFWQNTTNNESRPYYLASHGGDNLDLVINATNETTGSHYIYCGSASYADGSDGVDTYIVFDNFDGTTINTTFWDVTGGVTQNEKLIISDGFTDSGTRYVAPDIIPSTYEIEYKCYTHNTGPGDSSSSYFYYAGGGDYIRQRYDYDASVDDIRYEVDDDLNEFSPITGWATYKIVYDGSTLQFWREGVSRNDGTAPGSSSFTLGYSGGGTDLYNSYFDDFRMRKVNSGNVNFTMGTIESYVAFSSQIIVENYNKTNGTNLKTSIGPLSPGANNISIITRDYYWTNSTNMTAYLYGINFGVVNAANTSPGNTTTIYFSISTTGGHQITEVNITAVNWTGGSSVLTASLGSGSATAGTWNASWTAPASGSGMVNYTAEAWSNVTNLNRTSSQYNFTVDGTAPTVENCTYSSTNFITPYNLTVSCDVYDSGGLDTDTLYAYVGTGSYLMFFQSGNNYSATATLLSPISGNYNVYAQVNDSAGNMGNSTVQAITTSNVSSTTNRNGIDVTYTLTFPGNYTFNMTIREDINITYTGTASSQTHNYTYSITEGTVYSFSCNDTTDCNEAAGLVTFNKTGITNTTTFQYYYNFTIVNFTMNASSGATKRYVNITMPSGITDIGSAERLDLSFALAESFNPATDHVRIRAYRSTSWSAYGNGDYCVDGTGWGNVSAQFIYNITTYDSNADNQDDMMNISLDLDGSNFQLEFDKQSGAEDVCAVAEEGGDDDGDDGDGGGSGGGAAGEDEVQSILSEVIPTGIDRIGGFWTGINAWMKNKTVGLANALWIVVVIFAAIILRRFGLFRRFGLGPELGSLDTVLGLAAIAMFGVYLYA